VATPRKHWFKVPDSVLWESWSDTDLATLIRLQAFLNTRWARNGLKPEEACKATLDAAALHAVTKRERFAAGVATLSHALGNVTATHSHGARSVFVHWPKFAEFQFQKPESRPKASPSADSDSDAHARKKNPSRAAREKAPSASPQALAIAEHFAARVLEGTPYAKVPTNLDRWALHVDRLLRIDGVPEAEVRSVIDWTVKDGFWSSVVLSTAKLREKFAQLRAKSRQAPLLQVHSNRDSVRGAVEILSGGKQ
jgi:hypothetical protein